MHLRRGSGCSSAQLDLGQRPVPVPQAARRRAVPAASRSFSGPTSCAREYRATGSRPKTYGVENFFKSHGSREFEA